MAGLGPMPFPHGFLGASHPPENWVGEVTIDFDPNPVGVTLLAAKSAIRVILSEERNPLGIRLNAVGKPNG